MFLIYLCELKLKLKLKQIRKVNFAIVCDFEHFIETLISSSPIVCNSIDKIASKYDTYYVFKRLYSKWLFK